MNLYPAIRRRFASGLLLAILLVAFVPASIGGPLEDELLLMLRDGYSRERRIEFPEALTPSASDGSLAPKYFTNSRIAATLPSFAAS